MEPSTRKEMFLEAAVMGTPCCLTPETREEILLSKMAAPSVYRFYGFINGINSQSPTVEIVQGDVTELNRMYDENPTMTVEFVDLATSAVYPFVGTQHADMGPEFHFQRVWFDLDHLEDVVGIGVSISIAGAYVGKLPLSASGPA